MLRRIDEGVNFHRDWNNYVRGFGNPNSSYWLGLEQIHSISASRCYILRVILYQQSGASAQVEYTGFLVGDASSRYKMSVQSSSGTVSGSLIPHNNSLFSTYNNDNDGESSYNRASVGQGGWWYRWDDYQNYCGRMVTQTDVRGHLFDYNLSGYNILKSVEMIFVRV